MADRALTQNELMVLCAVLRQSGEAYGVSIRDDLERRTGRKMTFGVLYTILVRLEQDGLVTARDGEPTPERGGRAKKYFTISGKGQRAVNGTLADIDSMRPAQLGRPAHV